ncbi:MAG: RNase H family protein [Pirellulales bacterium]
MSQADRSEWSFTLAANDGTTQLGVSDIEPEVSGERLELLAVIRGLEALDQPSNVTIVTSSRYVTQGLAYGLDEWRRHGWTWQCFGHREEISNADLWRRLDHLLDFHRVECRYLRLDRPRRTATATAGERHRRSRLGRWLSALVAGEPAVTGNRRPVVHTRQQAPPRLRGPHWRRLTKQLAAG